MQAQSRGCPSRSVARVPPPLWPPTLQGPTSIPCSSCVWAAAAWTEPRLQPRPRRRPRRPALLPSPRPAAAVRARDPRCLHRSETTTTARATDPRAMQRDYCWRHPYTHIRTHGRARAHTDSADKRMHERTIEATAHCLPRGHGGGPGSGGCCCMQRRACCLCARHCVSRIVHVVSSLREEVWRWRESALCAICGNSSDRAIDQSCVQVSELAGGHVARRDRRSWAQPRRPIIMCVAVLVRSGAPPVACARAAPCCLSHPCLDAGARRGARRMGSAGPRFADRAFQSGRLRRGARPRAAPAVPPLRAVGVRAHWARNCVSDVRGCGRCVPRAVCVCACVPRCGPKESSARRRPHVARDVETDSRADPLGDTCGWGTVRRIMNGTGRQQQAGQPHTAPPQHDAAARNFGAAISSAYDDRT